MTVVDVSASGCQLAANLPADLSSAGAFEHGRLELEFDGARFGDDVRVCRAGDLPGSSGRHALGVEFLWTRMPGARSLRMALRARVATMGGDMRSALNRFVRDEQGQDIIEYALLAGVVSLTLWPVVTTIAASIQAAYGNVDASIPAGS